MAQHERHVMLGHQTYNIFFKKTQNAKADKSYDEFAKSPYYNAFVKFGSFMSNVNPMYPERFIEFVVMSGVKLDHWCREELYDQYVINLVKNESVETALERSVKTMVEWGDSNSAAWNHYFNYASLNRAAYDIKDGKISPWVVLNCNSGKDMLRKFNDEQLMAINAVMDISYWLSKFKRQPGDTELAREVIRESKI